MIQRAPAKPARMKHGQVYRHLPAPARKGLSLKDVAEAGGWKDTTTLLECYAQADPETIAAVVMHDAPARAVR